MEFLSFLGREEFSSSPAHPLLVRQPKTRSACRHRVAFHRGFNALAKLATHAPRPYWIGTDVKPLSTETSFACHRARASFGRRLGVLVSPLKSQNRLYASAALAVLIGFSRIYLASLHFRCRRRTDSRLITLLYSLS